jgi:hypothetical protein
MKSLLAVLLLQTLSALPEARAQLSCLPQFNSLQVLETVDLDAGRNFSYALKSENAYGLFTTRVFLSGTLANRELNLKAHFDETFDGISLPYNFYLIAIMQDGQVIEYVDFTDACNDPGLSFFPGQSVKLHPVHLRGSGFSRLQIVVWGRL